MLNFLRFIGLLLLLPGLVALGYSVYQGPAAWAVDSSTFWGTPISLFVFWIGLAHAGTLLSAIFLALDIKMDKRTAMMAELSTLCSLAIAVIFPLMHLGVLDRFYMVLPLADARANFSNIRSPLVWDFCCIGVYGILSLLFFGTHLGAKTFSGLKKIRKPLAWLLFPLVLWVHTVVSLDFAVSFVPEWAGAFFPVYFIVGAVYSGIALVCCILWFEGYRMRMLEKLLMISSWILCAIWLWNFATQRTFCASAFIFAGLLPQLYWVESIRETRVGRFCIFSSVLLGLFLERLFLVSPNLGTTAGASFGWVDLGLIAFSAGAFILAFTSIRGGLGSAMEGESTFFGEVDSTDMATSADGSEEDEALDPADEKNYVEPWASHETRTLRFPLFVGFSVATFFCIWCAAQLNFDNIELSLANVIPLVYPIAALVAAFIVCGKAYVNEVRPNFGSVQLRHRKVMHVVAVLLLIMFGSLLGAFYAGGKSAPSNQEVAAQPYNFENTEGDLIGDADSSAQEISAPRAALIWNSRCATCHGTDGKFNEKFIREYYPVPQKLDSARIDSIGVDSLVNVILNGRVNMNAYGNRLSGSEARGLVRYMQQLAKEAK